MNRLKTIRDKTMTYERSKSVVQNLKDLVTSYATDSVLSEELFNAFAWDDTPTRRESWSDMHSKLYHSKIPCSAELRLQMAIMLEELDKWLDGEPV